MRTVLCTVLVLFLIAGMVALPVSPVSVTDHEVVCRAADTSDGLDLFYTVTVEPGKNSVHIHVDIQNLPQSSLQVGFLNAPPDISGSVSSVVAVSGAMRLEVQHVDGNLWSVSWQGSLQSATIDYDLDKVVLYGGGLPYVGTGNDVAVYICDDGGLCMGEYVFMVPVQETVRSIRLKFVVPAGWQVVCPFVDCGTYYEVPKITNNLVNNFTHRQGIYFGRMRLYSECQVKGCTVKLGVLEADQSWETGSHLATQSDVDFFVKRTASAIEKFTEIFGENPYPVMAMYTGFASDQPGTYRYPGTREVVGGYQYWPPGRFDELIGHLGYSWFCFPNKDDSPISASDFIAKGLGESYLSCKLADELTGDKAYLGKLYQYYLVYKRALGTAYMSKYEIRNSYYKGAVFGLYLDDLIQKETNGSKSIEDVFGYLYRKYKNTGRCVQTPELQEAVDAVTGKDHTAVFNKYVYGDDEIPVQNIIQPYRASLGDFMQVLQSDDFSRDYHGCVVPMFVDIEMVIPLDFHIPFGLLCNSRYGDFARYVFANYDVNTLTVNDVESSLSKLTGQDCTGFFDRWKDSYGELTLDEMKYWLKSYMPYAPQSLSGAFHGTTVGLTWNPVQSRYLSGYCMITGYAVYRGTSPGTEVLLANVSGSGTYTDTSAVAGQTYYYYVESIADQPLGDGRHMNSEPSAEVAVVCKDTAPPFLTVMSPNDGATVATGSAVVSGTAMDDGAGMASTTINGAAVGLGSGGSFSLAVNLSEGLNEITILATDKAGNQATQTLKINYVKPAQTVTVVLHVGQTSFTVNKAPCTLDSPPIIKNGRTLLPIRAVIESLGGVVAWDGTGAKTTVTLGTTTLELWIGKPQALVNHNAIAVDAGNAKVVPEIVDGRTMLPLRFVAENLGFDVQWEPVTKTITITHHQ